MTTRLEAIGTIYKEQKHLGGPVVDIAANTYEAVDQAIRGLLAPRSEVNVGRRENAFSATSAAVGDTINSLRHGKLLRLLGDVIIGIPGGMIKDATDATLAKDNSSSVIIRHAA
ncbi:hypothetical protein HN512_04890 [Candidatus Peregrinibacteria bacterium]|jgi:hypothetical protein|nr:hypothetical protein [Candidatus Peregrinibacteria bacterium]MBT3599142.1 hypothetical protein [Candidatus Peregrinibacteria bacterium]MBT4367443.1 hypothetical protein [Candidatus Peregrinibacteria bacterium]MBT4585958.1 hypothetical protein [Candidatus Peregrinibacteria bacterium]MBT6730782.1 hypothetical protein [Candidatus Peregrinibacteria bacterium]